MGLIDRKEIIVGDTGLRKAPGIGVHHHVIDRRVPGRDQVRLNLTHQRKLHRKLVLVGCRLRQLIEILL